MRKIGKILFFIALVVTLISLFSFKVDAAQTLDITQYLTSDNSNSSNTTANKVPDNADEYEELVDESKKDEGNNETNTNDQANENDKGAQNTEGEKDNKNENAQVSDKKEENAEENTEETTNPGNIVNGQHATTGEFNNVMYFSMAIIAVTLIIIAYKKLQKYKY